MTTRVALYLLGAVAALIGSVGCSHYQWGHATQSDFTKIHIAVVENKTTQPQVVALVTTQLREAFIRDGRMTLLDSPDSAEVVLQVTLDDFTRGVAVVRADDTGLGRRSDLTLTARATLRDNRKQLDLFRDRILAVKRGSFADSGQLQSEYQAMSLLATELAEGARKAVLDRW